MTRMLPKSSSQKTLRAAMQEERTTTMASRLLSTDASLSNPSFRVYYGVSSAGSVPFLWESAPGTPKNAISDTSLPPLTPPPSYYNKATKLSKSKSPKKLLSSSKPASFVHSILPKLRRSHTMPSPSASKETVQCSRRKRLVASPRSSFSSTSRGEDEGGDGGVASPTSTLCFRTRHSGGGAGRLHGLFASVVGGQGLWSSLSGNSSGSYLGGRWRQSTTRTRPPLDGGARRKLLPFLPAVHGASSAQGMRALSSGLGGASSTSGCDARPSSGEATWATGLGFLPAPCEVAHEQLI